MVKKDWSPSVLGQATGIAENKIAIGLRHSASTRFNMQENKTWERKWRQLTSSTMPVPVVEFSREGYKIKKVYG